jgi:hypothetical protein
MTVIKNYKISSLRFKHIKGKSFYDLKTHRFINRTRARKLTYQKLWRRKWNEAIKLIQRQHPNWSKTQIRDKIKNIHDKGDKKLPESWFS